MQIAFGQASALELAMLAFLLGFYAVVALLNGAIPSAAANVIGSVALIAIMLWGCRVTLRGEPLAIWGALLWFRTACAVYYGVGALAPYVGTGSTLLYMQSLYPFSDDELLKINIIVTASVLLVLLPSSFMLSNLKLNCSAKKSSSQATVYSMAAIFLIVGGLARYAVVVPALIGAGPTVLAGAIASLAKLYSAGLMLLVLIGLRHRRTLLFAAALLALLEMTMSVLLFNKTDLIVTVLFIVLAAYHARPSLFRLAAGAMIAITLLAYVGPLVTYGRDRLNRDAEMRISSTLSQRLNIVNDYIEQTDTGFDQCNEFQPLLNRISYVNAMTMVVAWYDQGQPGSTLDGALAAFVPRMLWPDKPVMTTSGLDLYTQATGQQGTSISAGLFAEAYWNFGWNGLPLLLLPFGLVLGLISRFGVVRVKQESWLFLPVALMGVHIGTRVDGHYITDVIGASIMMFAFYSLTCVVEQFLFTMRPGSRRRKRSPST